MRTALLVVIGLLFAPEVPLRLRPIPVEEGFRDVVGTEKLAKSDLQKHARKVGIDLTKEPENPFVVQGMRDGRIFYVFYKTVENAFGGGPYLIQRIRRTERNWATLDAEPEVKVTYQVEVFKTLAGQLKRADQHYGYYVLRGAARREIVKEYEIGLGSVPGRCEGTGWPFESGILFKMLQGYGPERGVYDKVRLTRSVKWSLTVRLDDRGRYTIASPELGLDAPAELPGPERVRPLPVPDSKEVAVEEGNGIDGVVVGKSKRAEVDRAVPKPLHVVTWASGHTNVVSPRGYVVNLSPEGVARTTFTRPGFLGATRKGARHGDTRMRIVTLYGLPK
ncbi:MAG: hypothetical protein ACYS99_10860 [Planctomycetota bacterium]|jgi:hypothetical protein